MTIDHAIIVALITASVSVVGFIFNYVNSASKHRLEAIEFILTSLKDEVDRLKADNLALHARVKELEIENDKLEQKIDALEAENRRLRSKLREKQDKDQSE